MENSIILHCSDSLFGCLDVINKWHKEYDWVRPDKNGIYCLYCTVISNGHPYHSKKYIDEWDGKIEHGRKWGVKTNASGKGNRIKGIPSIPICLIGESSGFTENQIHNLIKIIVDKKPKHVFQHSDFDPERRAHCAGFSKKDMEVFNNLAV